MKIREQRPPDDRRQVMKRSAVARRLDARIEALRGALGYILDLVEHEPCNCGADEVASDEHAAACPRYLFGYVERVLHHDEMGGAR